MQAHNGQDSVYVMRKRVLANNLFDWCGYPVLSLSLSLALTGRVIEQCIKATRSEFRFSFSRVHLPQARPAAAAASYSPAVDSRVEQTVDSNIYSCK